MSAGAESALPTGSASGGLVPLAEPPSPPAAAAPGRGRVLRLSVLPASLLAAAAACRISVQVMAQVLASRLLLHLGSSAGRVPAALLAWLLQVLVRGGC